LHEKFVTIYDIEALRRDVESHEHSVRHALSIVGDLRSGMEQGVRFYSGFLDAARRTLTDVQEYASARRLEKEAIAEELRVQKARADERAAQMATQMNQMHFHQPPPPPQQYYHPSAPAYPSPAYGAQPPPPHWQNQPGRYANWENQS
jgi:programmed cell death 6-interacting protein